MSLIHSPQITLNGLVAYFDAGNASSYGGSGIIWTDISSFRNNGTLEVKDQVYNVFDIQVADYILPNSDSTNYPSYGSSNLGFINFDGKDDYLDFFAPNLGTTTTIEMWAQLGTSYQEKVLFGWSYYSMWCKGGNLGYNTGNGDVYGISSTTVNNLGLVNNWNHYVFEMRSDVSYTNNKIYINCAPQSLSAQASNIENSSNRNFNGGNGRLCAWKNNISYPIPLKCAVFKIYNRALTLAEIEKNFEVLRRRYGL